MTASQIGAALRVLVAGQTVGNWRAPDNQNYNVNVRLTSRARQEPQDLERLPVMSAAMSNNADGSARMVRLSQLASIRQGTGPEPDQPA